MHSTVKLSIIDLELKKIIYAAKDNAKVYNVSDCVFDYKYGVDFRLPPVLLKNVLLFINIMMVLHLMYVFLQKYKKI